MSASLNSRNSRRARRAGEPHARATRCLRDLWSVGPNIERDLQSLGVQTVQQLTRRSPERLYRQLERTTGKKQDPCVLDTFRATFRSNNVSGGNGVSFARKTKGRRQPTARRDEVGEASHRPDRSNWGEASDLRRHRKALRLTEPIRYLVPTAKLWVRHKLES